MDIVFLSDVISVLGTEDATTCHIAVLRHSGHYAHLMKMFKSNVEQITYFPHAILKKLCSETKCLDSKNCNKI